jgi:hypothetical protein
VTAQDSDGIRYKGEGYTFIQANGTDLFNPAQIGLKVAGWSTANNRGFVCVYEVADQSLYLMKAYLGLSNSDVEAMQRGEHPAVFGQIPRRYMIEGLSTTMGGKSTPKLRPTIRESFEFLVDDLKVLIPFTGGLLIGGDFIRKMYGFQAPYSFSVLHELVFHNGVLVEEYDRSELGAEFREKVHLQMRELETAAAWEMAMKWVESNFRFKYSRFLM